jgi:hypothetical protein
MHRNANDCGRMRAFDALERRPSIVGNDPAKYLTGRRSAWSDLPAERL